MNKQNEQNISNKRIKRNKRIVRFISTGQAANHCEVSLPALRRWIRDGRLDAVRTPGGHARIEIGEFQRFLKQYGMPAYPGPSALEHRPRVLVVEDEPDVQEMLTGMLSAIPEPTTVETAADGYEALIKVGTFKPNLLILDIVMPRLDGIEVCRRLRGNAETREIKILAITGRADLVKSALDAGADACLTKPFDLQLVEKELQRLLIAAHGAEPR